MEESQGDAYKYGMVIDLDKCTGCGTCMVACAAENNCLLGPTNRINSAALPGCSLYKFTNGKEFPNTEVCYIPQTLHALSPSSRLVYRCAPPPPQNWIINTGIVSQIYTRCIGCRYCQAACPYHARVF